MGSWASLGYRSVHQKCVKEGLRVSRRNVATILKHLDPEGVERRRRNSLQRRNYYSKGPNYVWHLDGYDKLKPYSLTVHACIDGYSRRILWLKVGITNKDPKVVCRYFTDFVLELNGIPRKIVDDRGTENVNIARMQRFLRRNHPDSMAGNGSFSFGRSVSN